VRFLDSIPQYAEILSFKFTSNAHILVLDKPEAGCLYLTMASLFELNQLTQSIFHLSTLAKTLAISLG
jgi:hypothetical protein